MKRAAFFSLILFFSLSLFAQPSDAVIRKDLMTPQTIDIKFTKTTGTRQWNSSTGNWEYVRGVHIRLNSKEYPGLVVKVVGDAVYQYTGAGKYSYWKFRTGYNEWEGISNPTEQEINNFIGTDWSKFYGYYFNKIIKLNSGPKLDLEKKFTWSNPNMVLFYMNVNADMISSAVHIDNADQVYEVRFYRDDIKSPWKNFLSVCGSSSTKVNSHEDVGAEKIRQLEQKTLAFTLAEEMANKELATLPQLEVPDFKSAKEMADFLHEILRNGNPDMLKVFMLKTLAPHLMVDGSKTQFSWQGKDMFEKAAKEAYQGDQKYKDQYCKNYYTTSLTSKSYIYIQSVIDKTITMIGTGIYNDGYKEGVPLQKIKLVNLDVSVRQDQDAINFLNSFSDRKKLCPND